MGKVFVVDSGFIRVADGAVVEGQVAYDEKGEVVATKASGSVVPALLDLGYDKKDIYHKRWSNYLGEEHQ